VSARRFVAIVLPQLAIEIDTGRREVKSPLAVTLVPDTATPPAPLGKTILATVNEGARRYGVRPGQTVSEALVLVPGLAVEAVGFAPIAAELGRVATAVARLGACVAM